MADAIHPFRINVPDESLVDFRRRIRPTRRPARETVTDESPRRVAREDSRTRALAMPMSRTTPIVFVVDDDVSVRESLELLIRDAGWQPEMFESAQDFLVRPRVLIPSCLVLDVALPGLNSCKSVSPPIEPTCLSSSSPALAMYQRQFKR
jgi:hypothetical protein